MNKEVVYHNVTFGQALPGLFFEASLFPFVSEFFGLELLGERPKNSHRDKRK